jgi:hypothetical protein
MTDKALSIAEAARRLQRSEAEVRRAIAAGSLAARRGENGAWSIDPAEVERRRMDWDVPPADRRRETDKPGGDSFGV